MLTPIREFLKLESAAGILLMVAAALAMIAANTPLSTWYDQLLSLRMGVHVGDFVLDKPLLLWINDGLMALFFFTVGLELKREVLDGELRSPSQVALPAIGALGGMILPAVLFWAVNRHHPESLAGWAIPTATDIAFALGVLSLLGKRVPPALKIFLVTLAIFDDIGAIIIIALFYTDNLAPVSLVIAGIALLVLFVMNRRGVSEIGPYALVGLVLWTSVLKSGVHATLAGLALAFFIPYRDRKNPTRSPLKEMEHSLHGAVVFAVLPVFAFANAGLSFQGMQPSALLQPIPLGVALGLFLGKQLGVFGFCWLAIKGGLARLPAGVRLRELYGLSVLCGVGFTMSLFIGSLAFENSGGQLGDRLGILVGSLVSAVVGYAVLAKVLPGSRNEIKKAE